MHHSGRHHPSQYDLTGFCEQQKTTKSEVLKHLRAKPEFFKGYKVEYKERTNIPIKFTK